MGSLYKGACFPTVEVARAEQCSQSGAVWGSTTSAYTVECTNTAFTTTTMSMCRRLNGAACTNYTIPFQTYPSCTYDGSTSVAVDYFGALLGFLLILYVGSRLKNYFWGKHESV